MDAEGRIIPIVEDDQGEGCKDIFEDIENELEMESLSHAKRSMNRERSFYNNGKIHSEIGVRKMPITRETNNFRKQAQKQHKIGER